MFLNIHFSRNIATSLYYNEKKIESGKAECILSSGFIKDKEHLSVADKLYYFKRLLALNERSSVNTFHSSLNFHPSDLLDTKLLQNIATLFMKKIGYSNQPFLVYRHDDAGHPHIHIVSVKIQQDGKAIHLDGPIKQYIFRITKEMDAAFGMLTPCFPRQTTSVNHSAEKARRITYGKTATKAAIAAVLSTVIQQYKFTSLHSFNAILSLYNVQCDTGGKNSMMQKHHGLLYRIIDENGKRTGRPIKASSFPMKPTFEFLKIKAIENKLSMEQSYRKVATQIVWVLQHQPRNLQEFKNNLEKEGISVVLLKDKIRDAMEISFIDHKLKSAFDGNELDTRFNREALFERFDFLKRMDEKETRGKEIKEAISLDEQLPTVHGPKVSRNHFA